MRFNAIHQVEPHLMFHIIFSANSAYSQELRLLPIGKFSVN